MCDPKIVTKDGFASQGLESRRLTPQGLLHFEDIGRENLDVAMEVLFACFEDEVSKEAIRTVFHAYLKGEISHSSLVYEGGTIEIKEQYLYRDREAKPVAVGGLYKESERALDDICLNWSGVVAQARRKHYGLEVLQHLEQVAISQGFNSLSVWKEEESGNFEDLSPQQRMYLKFGMQDYGERFPYVWEGVATTEMWLSKKPLKREAWCVFP
ncbi:MAG: hypothetical protein GYA55_12030 [SAR324 cluster bacterium]|uniref:N-acetyltransferase domain-containing protein n=1 Tax=SAR324 cluster bacterium TaxID=2024889 RepID=A0A7X9IL51_9DELT|nr:hypothetical protein [SAR324 cluster bacterium]